MDHQGPIDALPAPLVPADCDLRGMPFMPVDIIRLLDSDLFAISTGDEFKAAFSLWGRSWMQSPGGSLPGDERVLAHLSGDRANWPAVREVAMRGWLLCSDGRYYHPVVAEKAVEAWARRGDWRERVGNKHERQQRWRNKLRVLTARLREARVPIPENPKMDTLIELCGKHSISTEVTFEASTGDGDVDGETSTVGAKKTGKTGDSGQRIADSGQRNKKKEVGAKAPSDFVFEGSTIRLNRGDFDKWANAYHAIADLHAELTSIDAWFRSDAGASKRGNWFQATAGMLNKRHQERLADRQQAASAGSIRPGGGTPLASPC
jgi:hypothetical protein